MTSLLNRFDNWANAGDFTARSLGFYRIVYGLIFLLILPNFHWVSQFPDSMFNPPFGPMRLFSGFPPESVMRGIEALLAIALVALVIGWHTRKASVSVTVLAIIGYGFTYSMGKIDHTILLVTIPVFMALAGWGKGLSVDAARARDAADGDQRVEQWPLRLFALLVGLAFLTAAVPKVLAGWLNPSSQAVQATMFNQFYTHDRHQMLAGTFVDLHFRLFWESLDIFTILLEGLFVFAVVSWRSWRVACAIAALFHIGVYTMMNIAFVPNIVVYGAFVLWAASPLVQRIPAKPFGEMKFAAPVVVVAGVAWFGAVSALGNAESMMNPLIVGAGAAGGAAYLIRLVLPAVRPSMRGNRRSGPLAV